jgi:hypothetical protein
MVKIHSSESIKHTVLPCPPLGDDAMVMKDWCVSQKLTVSIFMAKCLPTDTAVVFLVLGYG